MESVRKDIRLYAGSEEEFSRLWNSLETGEYDEWMEAHKALLDRIDEDGARLGELQKQQGAAENEIYRLAGDDRITHALQEREEVETELRSAVEEWLSCMFASHFLKQAQLQYESGRQPKIVKKANEFLEAMTGGRYQLHVSEDGKSVYTTDRQHDKKDARFWSSGTGIRCIWHCVWPWHWPLAGRWSLCRSFLMIFLSGLMKDGRKRPCVS